MPATVRLTDKAGNLYPVTDDYDFIAVTLAAVMEGGKGEFARQLRGGRVPSKLPKFIGLSLTKGMTRQILFMMGMLPHHMSTTSGYVFKREIHIHLEDHECSFRIMPGMTLTITR